MNLRIANLCLMTAVFTTLAMPMAARAEDKNFVPGVYPVVLTITGNNSFKFSFNQVEHTVNNANPQVFLGGSTSSWTNFKNSYNGTAVYISISKVSPDACDKIWDGQSYSQYKNSCKSFTGVVDTVYTDAIVVAGRRFETNKRTKYRKNGNHVKLEMFHKGDRVHVVSEEETKHSVHIQMASEISLSTVNEAIKNGASKGVNSGKSKVDSRANDKLKQGVGGNSTQGGNAGSNQKGQSNVKGKSGSGKGKGKGGGQ